jgi:MFS transporter, NNP family, nitrate/nitrite transporter
MARITPRVMLTKMLADWSTPALWVFLGAYAVFAGMTWFFYLRTSFAARRFPSLAYASV